MRPSYLTTSGARARARWCGNKIDALGLVRVRKKFKKVYIGEAGRYSPTRPPAHTCLLGPIDSATLVYIQNGRLGFISSPWTFSCRCHLQVYRQGAGHDAVFG